MSKESTYPQDNEPGDTKRQSFKGLGTFQDPILFDVDDDGLQFSDNQKMRENNDEDSSDEDDSLQPPQKRHCQITSPLVGMPYKQSWIQVDGKKMTITGMISGCDEDAKHMLITYTPDTLKMIKYCGAPYASNPLDQVPTTQAWDGCLKAIGNPVPKRLRKSMPNIFERWLTPDNVIQAVIPTVRDPILAILSSHS